MKVGGLAGWLLPWLITTVIGLILLQIPEKEAQLLPNATSTHPREPNMSLIGLDVFHQLHCLDWIRKQMRADRYADHFSQVFPSQQEALSHADHCVDTIRQSLMCNADVSIINYQWSETRKMTLPNARVLHTCRRWDKIMAWTKQHLAVDFDRHEKAEGAPLTEY